MHYERFYLHIWTYHHDHHHHVVQGQLWLQSGVTDTLGSYIEK